MVFVKVSPIGRKEKVILYKEYDETQCFGFYQMSKLRPFSTYRNLSRTGTERKAQGHARASLKEDNLSQAQLK